METVEINVIMNNEFTNNFFKKSIQNIIDVLDETSNSKMDVHVKYINFIIASSDKDRLFSVTDDVIKKAFSGKYVTPVIKYMENENISEIFNELSNQVHSDADYVAYYGGNTLWVRDHLLQSIFAMKTQKRDWSVSITELLNDYTMKKSKILSYKEPNPTNHLLNDILIGEIVVKADKLKDVNFKRGIIKEDGNEFFYPGYALKVQLDSYAVCQRTTVRYHMAFGNEEQLHYIPEDYSFNSKQIKEEDKDKIIFSVIVNATNVNNQYKLMDAIMSLSNQQLSQDNFEVIFISNYNSISLFMNQNEILNKIKNMKYMFVSNHQYDEFGSLQSIVYLTGLQNAIGEYITYMDLTEGFFYSNAYLSELYVEYNTPNEENEKHKWIVSNYFDTVNYQPRHSNIKSLNRGQLKFSLFSHEKDLNIQYPTVKAIDKHFSNNNISLINIINHLTQQNVKGLLTPKALVQKIN